MRSPEGMNKKPAISSPLRQERELRGWSRSYVAEQLEVDVMTVGRWERGERLPQPYHRQKLCDLFEKNALELGLLSEPLKNSQDQDIVFDSPRPPSAAPPPSTDSPLQPATSPSQIPSSTEQEGDISTQKPRHRRIFLIGLAGLGATALAGGLWEVTHRIQNQSPSSVPAIQTPGKRLSNLLDPNTHNWINQITPSPDGSMLAAATGSQMLTIWNIQKNAIVHYYPTLNQWANDVSWSKTNLLAVANGAMSGGSIQVCQFPDNQSVFTLHRDYSMRAISWSPRGDYLAFAGHTATIEVWNPFTAKLVSHYTYSDQSASGINKVKWSSDARYLAAADDDGTVHVWETSTGKLVTIYREHQSRVVDMAWRAGGHLIATASTDETARVWDAISGRTITTYTGHKGEIHGIDWSPNKKYLASGSYDTTVQVWEALTGQHLATYTGYSHKVLTICWLPAGNLIASGSQGQGIDVWQAFQ